MKISSLCFFVSLSFSVSLLTSCSTSSTPQEDDETEAENPLCTTEVEAGAFLGKGVGGAFVPFEDQESVSIMVAPQGGFGIGVVMRTEGLLAGSMRFAEVQMLVKINGMNEGRYKTEMGISCGELGGRIDNSVFPLDPNKYETNDDLLALDGQEAELLVEITDAEGNSTSTSQFVTIRVGADA